MTYRLIFAFVLLIACKTAWAQSTSAADFDALICQDWKLRWYEEDGEKFPPAPANKDDLMTFLPDHKLRSVESDGVQTGSWHYEPATQTLTITDNESGETATMTVLELTRQTCVLEYKQPGGETLKMYLVATKV